MLPPLFGPTSRYKSLPCQVIWGRRDREVTPITVPWGDWSLVFNHRPPQKCSASKNHPPKHSSWGFWCIYLHANQKTYPVLYYPTSMECPTGPTGHPFCPFPHLISVDTSEIRRSAVDIEKIWVFHKQQVVGWISEPSTVHPFIHFSPVLHSQSRSDTLHASGQLHLPKKTRNWSWPWLILEEKKHGKTTQKTGCDVFHMSS